MSIAGIGQNRDQAREAAEVLLRVQVRAGWVGLRLGKRNLSRVGPAQPTNACR
jgi:hypothetical protein